jgi:hypothetical protein
VLDSSRPFDQCLAAALAYLQQGGGWMKSESPSQETPASQNTASRIFGSDPVKG